MGATQNLCAESCVFAVIKPIFSVHCTHGAHGTGYYMARYSPAPPHFSIGKTVNMRDQVIPKTGGILQAKRLLLVAVQIR